MDGISFLLGNDQIFRYGEKGMALAIVFLHVVLPYVCFAPNSHAPCKMVATHVPFGVYRAPTITVVIIAGRFNLVELSTLGFCAVDQLRFPDTAWQTTEATHITNYTTLGQNVVTYMSPHVLW